MKTKLAGLAVSVLSVLIASAQPATIEPCQYPGDPAAQAAWAPMRGTPSVSMAQVENRRALRFACDFTGGKVERASWDRRVNLDLSDCQGVQLQVLCRDASPVSYFSLYFESGNGWYHGTFFPESSVGWNSLTIDKAGMSIEGKPAGWGQIKTIRISAWRGQNANTEFYLADLRKIGIMGLDAAVAVVRADSVAARSAEERRSATDFAETIVSNLRAVNIGSAVIPDLELTPERLKAAKLVILPYNPSMPERALDACLQYLGQGGKMLAFYSFPERLWPAFQIADGPHVRAKYPGYFSAIQVADQAIPGAPAKTGQQSWNIHAFQVVPGTGRRLAEWLDEKGQPTGYAAILGSSNGMVMTHVLLSDDAAAKRRLLLAMAGALVPDLWRQAANGVVTNIGVMAGFTSYEDAVSRIRQSSAGNARAQQALDAAADARDGALKLAAQQKFPEAMEQAEAAGQKMKEAFCMAQQPLPGEFRAFWCHSAYGVSGLTWDEAIRRLADNGFTAILPNMLWGGVAFYPSKILPVAPTVAQRGDQVAQCLAACRKYGLQVHVWKVNWNLGSAAPKEFVEKLRREGRLQASSAGKEEPWLCPSHPGNQRLEVDSLVELARNYDLDGIHFDYIRYPDGDHCFCSGCRARFEQAVGKTLQRWPGDVLSEGPIRQRWLDWRRDNITMVVRAVSEKVRAFKPKLQISAAVFSNWTADRDGVGQDWKLWCDRGYLDFVCPMDYTPSNGSFENMVTRQVSWAGRARCYPGIGVSASSSHFGIDRLIEQINITRRHNTHGFTIFNYGPTECNELLPMLGLGITAKR